MWCSQTGNDSENNFAKFGYILDMKVGKKRIFLYSWLPAGTYHKNLAIWNFFFFKIWRSWVFSFSMRNPLHRLKPYFSGRNLAKIRQQKKEMRLHSQIQARNIAINMLWTMKKWLYNLDFYKFKVGIWL